MTISNCNSDVSICRDLPDKPTLTPAEMKSALDEGAQNLKDWLNNTHIPELNDLKVIYTSALTVAGWVGSAAPYTQALTVTGILATDNPHITPVYSTTNATAVSEREAWGYVCKAETTADTITFTCFEDVPTVAINLSIEVLR